MKAMKIVGVAGAAAAALALEAGTVVHYSLDSVVNIMGDHLRKGSDWNTRFWLSPRDTRYGAGLFPVVNETNNKGETTL